MHQGLHSMSLRALGLIPFAFIPGVIPQVVFANGLLLHGERMLKGKESKRYKILLRYDIFVNSCLCIYANVKTHYQPQTYCVTVFSFLSFLVNYGKDNTSAALWHIAFVQWPLAFCCYKHSCVFN